MKLYYISFLLLLVNLPAIAMEPQAEQAPAPHIIQQTEFDCPICYETIKVGSPYTKLPCRHPMCFPCYIKFAPTAVGDKCPLCRAPISIEERNNLLQIPSGFVEDDGLAKENGILAKRNAALAEENQNLLQTFHKADQDLSYAENKLDEMRGNINQLKRENEELNREMHGQRANAQQLQHLRRTHEELQKKNHNLMNEIDGLKKELIQTHQDFNHLITTSDTKYNNLEQIHQNLTQRFDEVNVRLSAMQTEIKNAVAIEQTKFNAAKSLLRTKLTAQIKLYNRVILGSSLLIGGITGFYTWSGMNRFSLLSGLSVGILSGWLFNNKASHYLKSWINNEQRDIDNLG